jgi:hypothetical protein
MTIKFDPAIWVVGLVLNYQLRAISYQLRVKTWNGSPMPGLT